ncbi:hypothetical protein ABQE69_08750 [Mycolicibacillus trivialis]
MKVKNQTPQRRSGERRRDAEPPRPVARRPRDSRRDAPGEPRAPRTGPQTTPRHPAPVRTAKNSSQAKARAKARKAKRPKTVRVPVRERVLNRLATIDLRPRTLATKVPFVVVIIGSLGLGLGLTLWLSTDSAERAYDLGRARKANQLLLQQKEALERDVLQAQAAPALAEEARKLGMIPTKDTAHLIQDPAGNWVVVGTPKPAEGMPPPPLNVKLPDEDPAPPPPPVNPVEVPVRVSTDPQAPHPATGPEVLVRSPDGAATLGTEHLPGTTDGPRTGPPPGPAQEVPAPVVPAPAPPAAQMPVQPAQPQPAQPQPAQPQPAQPGPAGLIDPIITGALEALR